MTAAQHIKFYDFFRQQLNIDDAKAKVFLEVVEEIVDNKLDVKDSSLAKKNEIEKIEHKIDLMRLETKNIISDFRTEMEKRFNQMIIWTVTTGIAVVGILVAFIKLK